MPTAGEPVPLLVMAPPLALPRAEDYARHGSRRAAVAVVARQLQAVNSSTGKGARFGKIEPGGSMRAAPVYRGRRLCRRAIQRSCDSCHVAVIAITRLVKCAGKV